MLDALGEGLRRDSGEALFHKEGIGVSQLECEVAIDDVRTLKGVPCNDAFFVLVANRHAVCPQRDVGVLHENATKPENCVERASDVCCRADRAHN